MDKGKAPFEPVKLPRLVKVGAGAPIALVVHNSMAAHVLFQRRSMVLTCVPPLRNIPLVTERQFCTFHLPLLSFGASTAVPPQSSRQCCELESVLNWGNCQCASACSASACMCKCLHIGWVLLTLYLYFTNNSRNLRPTAPSSERGLKLREAATGKRPRESTATQALLGSSRAFAVPDSSAARHPPCPPRRSAS